MFHYIYCLPLWLLTVYIIVLLTIWTVLSFLLLKYNKKTALKIINIVFLICSMYLILDSGVTGREVTTRVLDLNPFSLFIKAHEQSEMYRSMYMNLVMFLPLGVSLPFVLSFKKISSNILIAILIGFIFSVLIESIQYFFSIGNAEAADVMCNTVGVLVGTLPYLISNLIIRRKNG